MTVDPAKAASTAEYEGKLFHFCSRPCADKFRRDPRKYLEPGPKSVGMTGFVQLGNVPLQSGGTRRLVKDPVCGMNVDPTIAASTATHGGKSYYFCSRGCAEKFQRDPQKYLSPAHRPAGMTGMVQIGGTSATPGSAHKLEKDPVCGMSVDPAKAAAAVAHGNKSYYFCSRGCGEKFKADPEKYQSPSPNAERPGEPSFVAGERRAGAHHARRHFTADPGMVARRSAQFAELTHQFGQYDALGPFSDRDSYPGPA